MSELALLDCAGVMAGDLPAEGWADWLLTQLGSAVDGTLIQGMRLVVDGILLPQPEQLPEMRASALPFLGGELWEDPRRFFAFVDAPVAPVYVRGRQRRRLEGGRVVARELFTAYRPYPGLEEFVATPAPDDATATTIPTAALSTTATPWPGLRPAPAAGRCGWRPRPR